MIGVIKEGTRSFDYSSHKCGVDHQQTRPSGVLPGPSGLLDSLTKV